MTTPIAHTQITTLPIGNPPLDVVCPADADQRLMSVTTAIGCLDKPALLGWAAEETAKAAIRVAGTLAARIDEEGEDAVVEWLSGARYRRPKDRRSATELGTAVHDACERYAISGVRPETDHEVRPYLDQFDKWCQRISPDFLAAEMTVYSPGAGYAGTCDAVMSHRRGAIHRRLQIQCPERRPQRRSHEALAGSSPTARRLPGRRMGRNGSPSSVRGES